MQRLLQDSAMQRPDLLFLLNQMGVFLILTYIQDGYQKVQFFVLLENRSFVKFLLEILTRKYDFSAISLQYIQKVLNQTLIAAHYYRFPPSGLFHQQSLQLHAVSYQSCYQEILHQWPMKSAYLIFHRLFHRFEICKFVLQFFCALFALLCVSETASAP